MAKTKCPACKFDNCRAEFISHPSNTSYSSLELQISRIAEGLKEENISEFTKNFCAAHTLVSKSWLDSVFQCYDKLRAGVLLPKYGNKGVNK